MEADRACRLFNLLHVQLNFAGRFHPRQHDCGRRLRLGEIRTRRSAPASPIRRIMSSFARSSTVLVFCLTMATDQRRGEAAPGVAGADPGGTLLRTGRIRRTNRVPCVAPNVVQHPGDRRHLRRAAFRPGGTDRGAHRPGHRLCHRTRRSDRYARQAVFMSDMHGGIGEAIA